MSTANTRDELRARIDMIRHNLEAGRAGEWARMGYDADAIARCQRDAGRRIDELSKQLHPRSPRKPRRHA
jgi:hypothetical protein